MAHGLCRFATIAGLQRRNYLLRPALLLALLVGGLLIMWAGREIVFLQDEWAFVTTRIGGDADAYLQPHNEHLMLFPVAVFKFLFAVVGLGHYWPYRLALTIVHLICVALLFVIVERRRGPALAALVVAPVLLLGSSSEVLLFPIDLGFAGSMAAGLGALLALDARSRGGDILAGFLLAFALASSGLGISIALGVLVEVMWDRDRWRRVWVVAAPLALYGLWYLGYNLHPNRQGPLRYTDAPGAPRYVYASAILILLIAVEATRGVAIARPVLAGLALVAVGSTALNLHWLEWNGDQRRAESRLVEGELGALELARGRVAPDFRPILRPAYPLVAGRYFAAVDAYKGSVATPPSELPTAAAPARAAADAVLIRATVSLLPDTPATRRYVRAAPDSPVNRYLKQAFAPAARRRCTEVRPEHGQAVDTRTLPARGVLLVAQGDQPITARLGRFGDGFAAPLPPATREPQVLLAPRGRSPTPWRARLSASGPFQVC